MSRNPGWSIGQRSGSILASMGADKIRHQLQALDVLDTALGPSTRPELDREAAFALRYFMLKSHGFAGPAPRRPDHRAGRARRWRGCCAKACGEHFPDGLLSDPGSLLPRGWWLRAWRAQHRCVASAMRMVVVVTGPVAVAAAPHIAEQFARQAKPVRVLHFVTGGFSGGATQVAIALTRASLAAGGPVQPLLVLRSKYGVDPRRIAELREQGLPVATVPRWPRLATILRLALICRSFRADVLIAHGYSEHLWGRYAGLLAGVKNLVQVEHNTRERYTPFRRLQARWLARRTACFVGCSQAVCDALSKMGLPAERIMAIPNGIGLERSPARRCDR